ncbi:MAG: GAF domain-containing protein [Alphaproteobacteria bacterium]|nr:GAF domain-containing protein [Alphaproteobacteria bacterium]
MIEKSVPTKLRFSLQVHLSTIFLVVVVAVCLSIGAISYKYAVKLSDTSTNTLLEQVNRVSNAEAQALFLPAEGVANLLSSNTNLGDTALTKRMRSVLALLQGLKRSRNITAVFVGNDQGDFMLARKLPTDPELAARFNAPDGTAFVVQILERNKEQVARGYYLFFRANFETISFQPREDYTTYDPRERPWYSAALQSNTAISTAPYVFYTTQEIGMTIAQKGPTGSDGGQFVIGVDITLKTLGKAMEENRVTPSTKSILLTTGGLVVADADPTAVTRLGNDGKLTQSRLSDLNSPVLNLGFERFRNGEGNRHHLTIDNAVWDVSYSAVPIIGNQNFVLAMAVPRAEMMQGLTDVIRTGVLWSLGLMLASIILVLGVSRLITNPLRALKQQADAVSRFDFNFQETTQTRISDIQDLSDAIFMMKETIRRFLDISQAFAAEEDFDELMKRLLDEIIGVTKTEAGILYLTDKDGTRLVPHAGRLNENRPLDYPLSDVLLSRKKTLLARSILDENAEGAQATATELEMLGLGDIAKAMDDPPRNMIAAPLFNRQKELVGVLLLLETDHIMDQTLIRFTEALSGSAAISLEARQLIVAQRELFESFIQMIASAIDAKSPYTGGHCARVPELTKMLATAADASTTGAFANFKLTDEDWEAIHVAAWLHDCGKVTTPEFVVDKATKLETIYDRIHEIRMRVEVMKREAEITYLRDIIRDGDSQDRKEALEIELNRLDDDFAFLAKSNIGGEFMTTDEIDRLRTIGAKTWTRTLDDRIGISHEELSRMERRAPVPVPAIEPLLADRVEHRIERPIAEKFDADNVWGFKMDVPELLYNRGELHNLSIRRGTLTDEDRYKINEHIVQTIKMLDRLPFPKHLSKVPELAGGHHEKMDGTGYPKKLTKDEMSPVARMMAIADIFEALTAVDRPYKKGKKLSEALKIMGFMAKDSHVDPELFDLFLTQRIYEGYAQKYLTPEQIDSVDPEDFRIQMTS